MIFRKLHRKIAPIIFLPLLMSILSGIAYRIGRSWFGASDQFGELMMSIHEGRYLGKPLVPIYVLLTGLGLAAMLVSGVMMIKRRKQANRTQAAPAKSMPSHLKFRLFHRFVAPILTLPLLLTTVTGISYRLGRAWFGLPKEQAKFLLDIHQGSYFGKDLRSLYVLFIGIGLLTLIVTGMQMSGILRDFSIKNQQI